MRGGAIQWNPSQSGTPLSVLPSHRARLAVGATTDEEVPEPVEQLSEREKVVFLLHVAAEVEHSLLVQYLYAYFSLGNPTQRPDLSAAQKLLVFGADNITGWGGTILKIAREEMGHLLTVQNLLLALRGPLTFEREDFPFRTEYYPFPFMLEPLTKDSLAKYVATERPMNTGLPTDELQEILDRATGANNSLPINRVGPLYKTLIRKVEALDPGEFEFGTAGTLQADPNLEEWRKSLYPRLIVSPIASKTDAKSALSAIAEQGEGPTGGGTHESHFDLFLSVYRAFPETNGDNGPVDWRPALAVPTHPNTAPPGAARPGMERGQITNLSSRNWAILFNLRYRMLLAYLAHALRVDRTKEDGQGNLVQKNCRDNLIAWTFQQMFNLSAISSQLVLRDRQSPNGFDEGRARKAGAPFELPYTLNLPDDEEWTWRLHLDMIEASNALITKIRGDNDDPGSILAGIAGDTAATIGDTAIRTVIEAKLAAPDADCTPA